MLLYLLIIYGFNHMIRFNKKGDFNLPVGNLDFNENVYNALNDYFAQTETKQPQWHSQDFSAFLAEIDFGKDDLVYLDPPYLISSSEYNKMWNEECERNLIREMDRLDAMGVRFAVSNAITYRGKKNDIFGEWAKKYNIHPISSNYISYWDNSRKESGEVLVTNY
ncbi:MAG: DNA adenine methylase [Prevotellaceae bacterium]|nr:DNA adenine methylase [Prevotellaceae bacterium]